jgi:thiol-disulfide isomerase/thioredoxin
MKQQGFWILTILCSLCTVQLLARDGYKVQVKYTDVTDSMIYLAHYYGKSTEAYRIDSTHLSKEGVATFSAVGKITGGMYLFLFKDKKGSTEFILNNGDDISIQTSKKDVYAAATVKGSKDNELYYAYQRFLTEFGKGFKEDEAKLKTCKNKTDSDAVIKVLNEKFKVLGNYRKEVAKKNPTLFLASLFNSLQEPEVPKDSPNSTAYYKQHFWDYFDFKDDRIIYTPAYESKLEHYFSRIVYPSPDSVNFEVEKILKKAEGSKDMYKYTLWFMTKWTEKAPYMGLDESYVYLVENYFLKGKAWWADSAEIKGHIKRAAEIAPCLLNQRIRDITVSDTSNTKRSSLHAIKSNYTILLFWSPSCSHCQTDVPQFDSLLKSRLKNYDLKILSVIIHADEVEDWKKFIRKHDLSGSHWIHGYDPSKTINFKTLYDVYTTPTLYLLDRDKKIIGKRLDAKSLPAFLENFEKKKK